MASVLCYYAANRKGQRTFNPHFFNPVEPLADPHCHLHISFQLRDPFSHTDTYTHETNRYMLFTNSTQTFPYFSVCCSVFSRILQDNCCSTSSLDLK